MAKIYLTGLNCKNPSDSRGSIGMFLEAEDCLFISNCIIENVDFDIKAHDCASLEASGNIFNGCTGLDWINRGLTLPADEPSDKAVN